MDLPRLRALLGTQDLAWIVERARTRLERGEPLVGAVRLATPSATQREALRRLLGLGQLRGEAIGVRLEDLDELLVGAELCSGLTEAVVELTGPVSNLRLARSTTEAAWAQLFADQRTHWAALADHAGLGAFIDSLQMKGILLRSAGSQLDRGRALLADLARLVAALPADLVTRAELAARLFGDAHALDEDQVLGRLGLQAAVAWAGQELDDSPDGRRTAWEQVGVLVDTLSAPLLALNLQAELDTFPGRLLQLHAAAGEPARLSARCLLRQPPRFSTAATGAVVFVCENPSIVAAAAERLGGRCAPLLCTEGQPRTAAHLVLRALRRAGIEVRYHGDLDWPGIVIANLLIERHDLRPWRLFAADYRAAPAGKPLSGKPVAPTWDPQLQTVMLQRGCAVYEEQVMEQLLQDLSILPH